MSKTKHAYVTTQHTNGDTSHLVGAVIRNMPINQFNDLGPDGIGYVREATAKEAADQAKPVVRPRRARKAKALSAARAKAKAPAEAPAPTAAPAQPDPQDAAPTA